MKSKQTTMEDQGKMQIKELEEHGKQLIKSSKKEKKKIP